MQYLFTPLDSNEHHQFSLTSRHLNAASTRVIPNDILPIHTRAEILEYLMVKDKDDMLNYNGNNIMVISEIVNASELLSSAFWNLYSLCIINPHDKNMHNARDESKKLMEKFNELVSLLERNIIYYSRRGDLHWLHNKQTDWINGIVETAFDPDILPHCYPEKNHILVFLLIKGCLYIEGDLFEQVREYKELFESFVKVYNERCVKKGIEPKVLDYKTELDYGTMDHITDIFSKN